MLDTGSQSLSKGNDSANADCASLVRNDGKQRTEKNLFTSKKVAFTLAEVLITLGIIGVVAAMTIPSLISSHRKHLIETRLAKFYSTINQAIVRAEVDYGDRRGWDVLGGKSSTQDKEAASKMSPYDWVMKYIVPYVEADVKYLTKEDDDASKVLLYFPDGSSVAISDASWIFFPDASKCFGTYSEFLDKQKDGTGKYMFTFLYNQNYDVKNYEEKYLGYGVEPYVYYWDGTREDLFNSPYYGCATEDVVRAFCTELIRQNGWKIPNDYPIKI